MAVNNEERREHVFDTIEDLVGKLLYYDRKEDDELPHGTIEKMFAEGEITMDEIVEKFRSCVAHSIGWVQKVKR